MPKHIKYWFKRRRYGYGWIPVKWQGFVVIVAFIIVVTVCSTILVIIANNSAVVFLTLYLAAVLMTTAVLLYIAYRKGPKPKWRWGKSNNDKPNEDF